MEATIEVHHAGVWHHAAMLQGLEDDRCRLEYLPEYIFGPAAVPISLGLPVGLAPDLMLDDGTPDRRVPAFLYDLVPQGRGRRFLIDLLQIEDVGDRLVMPLLFNGAFNPIGCLRVSSAVDFYKEQARRNPTAVGDGFTIGEIEAKTEEFLEHMALHAMLAAGTTGVQGVAPKYLLTADAAGRFFADLALPDNQARDHWLVKLPRGSTDLDLLVHRSELAYLRLSARCGVRALADPHLVGRMLFVRRFDRECGSEGTVVRHHQESLASLAGIRGFGQPTSQNAVLAAMRQHVSDPYAETVEFLKRDVLNLAMRNTDNHARNTAVQRLGDGTVQLTPLYDFCPMYLDPEVVPRTLHWRDAAGNQLKTWTEVLERLDVPDDERKKLTDELRRFAKVVAALPDLARDCELEMRVLEQCLPAIEAQTRQLDALPTAA